MKSITIGSRILNQMTNKFGNIVNIKLDLDDDEELFEYLTIEYDDGTTELTNFNCELKVIDD